MKVSGDKWNLNRDSGNGVEYATRLPQNRSDIFTKTRGRWEGRRGKRMWGGTD